MVDALGKIACTVFETESIPATWLNYLEDVDTIWVPSKYNLDTFKIAGVDSKKLDLVPYSYDPFYVNQRNPWRYYDQRNVQLLYVCSNLNRKDPILLITAFLEIYQLYKNIELTIKINSSLETLDKLFLNEIGLNKNQLEKKNIFILTKKISKIKLRQLYEKADLYTSSERAKGWDFPAFEAIGMGVPCVTINSSALEFLNKDNSYLVETSGIVHVDNDLVENEELYNLHYWQDVSIQSYTDTLKKAIGDALGDKLGKKIKNCRREIIKWSPAVVGELAQKNLDSKYTKQQGIGRCRIYV